MKHFSRVFTDHIRFLISLSGPIFAPRSSEVAPLEVQWCPLILSVKPNVTWEQGRLKVGCGVLAADQTEELWAPAAEVQATLEPTSDLPASSLVPK